MKPTIEQTVRKFLIRRTWTYGGTIEEHVRVKLGSKGSTTSRKLREMSEDGALEKRKVLINSKWVVQYKIR